LTRSECQIGHLQMVCRKRHQQFGHDRLSTSLGQSDGPFG
jgi:hypothetical protein